MKKFLGKLLAILLILSILASLAGCKLQLDLGGTHTPPDGEGTDGSIEILGGAHSEWGAGGYDINTTLKDKSAKAVSSLAEANAWIDASIMSHFSSVLIDFSAVPGYSPTETGIDIEFSNHIKIEKHYYDSRPWIVEFVITYQDDAATYFATPTEENDHRTVLSGNLLARLASIPEPERRAADFDGFAINSVEDTVDVYNSEELWWALARGYRPTFPLENSKAESFYLEAKRILRHIVTDEMTDYEKLLSIYEYLVSAVEYDYDSFYAMDEDWHGKNACYYLEGVFEAGRAVCDGKSKAFVLFCAIEGIPCLRDYGRNISTGINHAWNYVKLDGTWYLVDTTEADACVAGDIGEFLGDSAEIIRYESFLCPISHYVGEYIYSDTFPSITDRPSNETPSSEHYTAGLYDGNGYDFVIDRSGELAAICTLAFSAAYDTPFSLTVKYYHYFRIHQVMEEIVEGENYEYDIFVLNAADKEYLIVFNPLKVGAEE